MLNAKRGQEKFNSKDYAGAIGEFTTAIKIFKRPTYKLLIARGEAYQQLGNYELALKDYENAIPLNESPIEACHAIGNIYYLLMNYAEAIQYFSSALRLLNSSQATFTKDEILEIKMKKAFSFYHLKDYSAALNEFQKMLEITAKDSLLHYYCGQVYFKQHNFDNAKNSFLLAIEYGLSEQDSNISQSLFYKLGAAHYMSGNYLEAIDWFSKSIDKYGYFDETSIQFEPFEKISLSYRYYGRGRCYYNEKKYQEAENDLQHAITLAETNFQDSTHSNHDTKDAYLLLGCCMQIQEKYAQALGIYNKAISLFPEESRFYNNRAVVKSHLNDVYESILSDCNKAIELNPENNYGVYYLTRANMHYDDGRYKEAFSDYKTAISYDITLSDEIYRMQLRQYVSVNINLIGEENGGLREKNKFGYGYNGYQELLTAIQLANKEDSLHKKAAILALSIRGYQPFRDGNTRTAGILLQYILLEYDSYYLNKTAAEIYAKLDQLDDKFRNDPEEGINALVNWMNETKGDSKSFKRSKNIDEDYFEIFVSFQLLGDSLKTYEEINEKADAKGYIKPEYREEYRRNYSKATRSKYSLYIQTRNSPSDGSDLKTSKYDKSTMNLNSTYEQSQQIHNEIISLKNLIIDRDYGVQILPTFNTDNIVINFQGAEENAEEIKKLFLKLLNKFGVEKIKSSGNSLFIVPYFREKYESVRNMIEDIIMKDALKEKRKSTMHNTSIVFNPRINIAGQLAELDNDFTRLNIIS